MSKVGFIGLGEMGFRMARNLARAGVALAVSDVRPEPIAQLQSEFPSVQIVHAKSPSEALAFGRVAVTMLPEPRHVLSVWREGKDSLLANARGGDLLIDSSTIDPITSRLLFQEGQKAGATVIDAPVSGGIGGAEKASLTFMVGGGENPAVFDKVSTLLKLMGKNIVNCGPPGTGQVAKVCNNLILGISMVGVAEAYNLGSKLGMDPKVLASVVNTSSGRCWSSDTYNPVPGVLPDVPASRDYAGGFGVELMAKDISLAVQAAHSLKAPLFLGAAAQQFYNTLSAQGLGKKDFGVAYKFLNSAPATPK